MILPARARTAVAWGWRLAAVLATGAATALILTAPSEQFGPVELPPEAAVVDQVDEPAAEPPEARNLDYPAIAAHPLFFPTRNPWTPPAPEPPAPVVAAPSTLSGYALVGVVASGSLRSALIRAPANKVVTLSEGEEIEGWTLKSISRERLYFSSGEATYEMTRRKPSESQP